MKTSPYAGKFIVLEGLDGSGKSTQAQLLLDYLKNKKIKSAGTFEPTQFLIGGLIRSALSGDWESSSDCIQLLFSADRAYHLEKEIIPRLKEKIWVVCDRYLFSTLAYGALDCDLEWLSGVNANFLFPDLTLVLKSDPKLCIKRIAKERFSVELFEKEEKLKKIWANYEIVIQKFKNKSKIVVINGDQDPEKVFEDLKKIVDKTFSLL